jgi:hypothetical protein
MNIALGYEIGTGKRVSIPVNHTVVLGQTQVSGKTTTLEAMVTRSGLRAVGFITKAGEKSFRLQTQIPAFFSESTITDYWKYVVSIVENLMSVKLGWQERGWIVKLCQDYEDKTKAKAYKWKRPKTLKELLRNCTIASPHLRGTAEMIVMQLTEYLQSVVREIGQTEFSAKLELEPGINVMDVTELSDGLKALVIRSVIEHVHKRGRRIIVIIPEAWKFIPEGRSTPVKLALEGLIREGAGVGNFVWMDSQDLRGVDKLLLRSVIVWLFGVQRQKNEVASTLASIPDHPKPTATEIMQLGKGEFYVCYGQTLVWTYVQPAGMEDAHAQAIARGDESPDSWRQISKALDDETGDRGQGIPTSESLPEESASEIQNQVGGDRDVPGSEDDAVWKEKYEALEEEHKTLIETHDALAKEVGRLREEMLNLTKALQAKEARSPSGASRPPLRAGADEGEGTAESEAAPGAVTGAADARSALGAAASVPANGKEYSARRFTKQYYDAIYGFVKRRAEKDPGILELLTRRPELRVTVERPTIEADSGTLRGALALMISKKFFDSPQNGNTAFNELKRLGRSVAKPNVYRELDKLADLGFVTKEETGYQAVPGMKIYIVEQVTGGRKQVAGA